MLGTAVHETSCCVSFIKCLCPSLSVTFPAYQNTREDKKILNWTVAGYARIYLLLISLLIIKFIQSSKKKAVPNPSAACPSVVHVQTRFTSCSRTACPLRNTNDSSRSGVRSNESKSSFALLPYYSGRAFWNALNRYPFVSFLLALVTGAFFEPIVCVCVCLYVHD
jgi:hypothetical protein